MNASVLPAFWLQFFTACMLAADDPETIRPICPMRRWLYLIDWRDLSQVIRFDCACGRCGTAGAAPAGDDSQL